MNSKMQSIEIGAKGTDYGNRMPKKIIKPYCIKDIGILRGRK